MDVHDVDGMTPALRSQGKSFTIGRRLSSALQPLTGPASYGRDQPAGPVSRRLTTA